MHGSTLGKELKLILYVWELLLSSDVSQFKSSFGFIKFAWLSQVKRENSRHNNKQQIYSTSTKKAITKINEVISIKIKLRNHTIWKTILFPSLWIKSGHHNIMNVENVGHHSVWSGCNIKEFLYFKTSGILPNHNGSWIQQWTICDSINREMPGIRIRGVWTH